MRFTSCNGLAGFQDLGLVQNGFELAQRTGTLDFGDRMIQANRHLVGDGWESHFSDDPFDWPIAKDVQVVAGLPPCSGFSCWTGPANRGPNAKAHKHTHAFVQYVARAKPNIAFYECVQQSYTQGRDMMQGYRKLLEDESGLRYDLHHVKMNNLMIGGHSFRPRYFWVAVREGMPFGTEYSWPDALPSLVDVIGDLADLHDTWEKQPYRVTPSRWLKDQVSPMGAVDGHKRSKNIHGQRIEEVFEWLRKTDDDWNWGEGLSNALKRVYEEHGTLPPLWSNKADKIIEKKFDMGFSLPYRWAGNAWANVLTGGALDMVIHPTRPRCISHREAARIQGLPDDWRIKPARDYGPMRDAWGKAVSVHAGRWIGHWVKAALEGRPGAITGEPIGEREWLHETDKGFSRQKARARYFPESKGGVTRAYNPELWPWGRPTADVA